ncbi:MAG: hypothetical protein ACKOX3_07065, partial [Bacteroidota bacterium]
SKINTDISSGNVETQRINICLGQYYTLGGLMQKYVNNTDSIGNFFDLEAIRKSPQTLFTGHLAPMEIKTIAKRTFEPDTQIRLKNIGETILQFYLIPSEGHTHTELFIQVEPNSEMIVNANQLGDVLTMPYFTVNNLNDLAQGAYEAEIL